MFFEIDTRSDMLRAVNPPRHTLNDIASQQLQR
jgi:hypothetical protein